MTFHRISRKDLLSGASEVGPGDGLDPRLDRRGQDGRELGRKTLQLCGQVARTLRNALPCCGDDVLRDLVIAEVSLDDFRNACRKQGMRTLRESGLRSIHAGFTSIEEVIRETMIDED